MNNFAIGWYVNLFMMPPRQYKRVWLLVGIPLHLYHKEGVSSAPDSPSHVAIWYQLRSIGKTNDKATFKQLDRWLFALYIRAQVIKQDWLRVGTQGVHLA